MKTQLGRVVGFLGSLALACVVSAQEKEIEITEDLILDLRSLCRSPVSL